MELLALAPTIAFCECWNELLRLVNSSPEGLTEVFVDYYSRAQPSTPPGEERLMVWFEFLVTNTFLIWNVRWAIKSQNAQLEVATSSKCKMPPRFYSKICNFCAKERTVCISTLVCSFKNWATTNQLPNKLRRFASLCEQRMSLADLVKVEDRNEEVCCSFH